MRIRPRSAALAVLAAFAAACTEQTPVAPSTEISRDVGATALPPVRISEIHYDNNGTDVGEAIEISGPAGTNLTGYSIVLYNGSNNQTYTPLVNLTATIPQNCTLDNTRGVVVQNYAVNGLQNGNPDAVALVNGSTVIEFISYGGTITAANGPAQGMTSVDIGVMESAATPVGSSLQRNSAGTWSAATATFNTCNDDDTSTPPAVVTSVVVTPATPSIVVGNTQTFVANAFDASNQPVAGVTFTWSSATTATATINSNGTATAVAAGTSVITASAPNGVSGTATLTVTDPPPPTGLPATRFSEIHYDNVGTDVNERIEIEGPVGTSLTGWSVVLYNGNGGVTYNTSALSGVITANCTSPARGVVVVSYPQDGLQNGSPDGFALVDKNGAVVEFLSYEGTLTATNGPANGTTSTDIVASQTNAPLGQSLQRDATGAWAAASATFGGCNADGGPPPSGGSISFSGRLPSDPVLPIGYQDQLFATARDGNGATLQTTFTWASETPALASIDQNGVMTAIATGNAVFRATTADGTITATYSLPMGTVTAGSAVYASHAEFGEPGDANPADDYILRRAEYTVSFSNVRNTPNWVSYNLEATHFGAQDRCDCFTYDPLLPSSFARYTTNNYTGAGTIAGYGIDRGHLARSFDRTSGSLDNAHSFLFSNIIPQTADQNQGPWANMENFLGDLAMNQNKEVHIVAGVAGNIGTVKNEGLIVIPEVTWKVAVIMPRDQGLANVVTGQEPQIIAVIMPNVPGIRNVDWNTYRTTVDAIEAVSGYDLLALLPDGIESQLESGNAFPIARTGGPYSGVEGSAVQFNGTLSSDPNNDALTYSWNFGDGTSATGASPSHVFANNGTYGVTLTVTDSKGASSNALVTVTISNSLPVVTLTPPANWAAGQSRNLGVLFTDANPKDAPFTVRINWGDGTAITTFVSTTIPANALQRPHVYAASGSYTITVTVTDKDGGVGTKTLAITVP